MMEQMATPSTVKKTDPVAEGGSPVSERSALPPAVIVADKALLTEIEKVEFKGRAVTVAAFVEVEPK
jgi:hypothetical protein